ncbi:hypothetical protein Suden_0743 [Sulfurimonas denitrificans DSM 1251]|uniref:Lipoprotein n=1 Tax=Sulfurimonas denitrificans (strain ATCC 33889 / DSM 1251) TaxID=326298 RepID=Q30SK9_SULDN|nr:hypothetical protein [Sulfurimonas denitrificans]ABB44022.1 hypothetical protein Suden_0743 [Sulfurimonas denitrificans DSM 1251]MDD3443152.1 hypothetical protein [Sulfurimonas denitrificans]
MKNIILFILVALFAGCDGVIYTNIYDKSRVGIDIKSVEIVASDEFSKKSVSEIMQSRGFLVGNSEYRLRVEHRDYKKTCTNPLSKTSSDYSFDGLVSIELFFQDKKLYNAYKDYKGEKSRELFEPLIKEMINEMEIKSSY